MSQVALQAILGVLGVVTILVSLAIAIYMMIYWSDPKEIFTNTFTRALIVIGFFLTFFLPSLISIDVTLQFIRPEEIVMQYVWLTAQVIVLVFGLVIYPFISFVIDESIGSRKVKCKAIGYAILCIVVEAAVIVIISLALYFTIGGADIRLWQRQSSNSFPTTQVNMLTEALGNSQTVIHEGLVSSANVVFELNFPTYFLAVIIFLGTIFYTVFFSIGLAAVPWDLIQLFRYRPRMLGTKSLENFKNFYGNQARDLIAQIDQIYQQSLQDVYKNKKADMANDIKNQNFARIIRRQNVKNQIESISRQTQEIYAIFTEVMNMNDKKKAKPLVYVWKLILGILSTILSSVIVVQLVLLTVRKILDSLGKDPSQSLNPFFLGDAFKAIDGTTHIPLISSILFFGFGLYLTACFVRGVTKFGFRFILFIQIHPMIRQGTTLNSMIFNVTIMTICILPQLQFIVYMFSTYTEGSTIYMFFGTTVSNLKYLRYFFDYYMAGMVLIFIITTIITFMCPGKAIKTRAAQLALQGRQNKGLKMSDIANQRNLSPEARKIVKRVKEDRL